MKRGEVWWVDLPEPAGSEPGCRRPVPIAQADDFNRSRLRTVLAAAITSNLAIARAPGNLPLPRRSAGLERESVVNVSQIVTVDKRFLMERAGRLSGSRLRLVEEGLRLVLASRRCRAPTAAGMPAAIQDCA